MTERTETTGPEAMLREALGLIERGDAAAAFAALEANGDPGLVGRFYAELARLLYRQRRLAAMLACGNAGLRFHLRHAEEAGTEAARIAQRIAGKTLAYNVAANCWPGWGDEGVALEPAQIEAGRAMAERSLALVEELGLEAHQSGNAHWLVGALEFALGRHDRAAVEFAAARDAFAAGGEGAEVLLARGYLALVFKASPGRRAAAVAELDAVVAALELTGSEDAGCFVAQLRSADRIINGG